MDVLTIRVQDYIAKAIDFLAKEKRQTRAEVARSLISKAAEEEEVNLYLKKYQNKEISIRELAKKLDMPYWKAYELTLKAEFPYKKEDLQRDLRLIEEI